MGNTIPIPLSGVGDEVDQRLTERYSLHYIARMMKKKKHPLLPESKPRFTSGTGSSAPADSDVENMGGFALKSRFWIARGEETFLGIGRVTLLERIRICGSISEAARSMGMSYRHAWELVESMNRIAARPLVTTAVGGRGGGGAVVTSDGEEAIRFFHQLQADMTAFLEEKNRQMPDFI